MGRLLLIRHGQASLGASDYDVLSPLGARQAEALGRHLAELHGPPHALYTGPHRRQRDTAARLAAAARVGGVEMPDPVELPEFSEYPALALMKEALPDLCAADPELAALADAWRAQPPGGEAHRRAFERCFQAAMRRWHEGQVHHPAVEPCAAFLARVERGLRRVTEDPPRGATVLVVTSAGPVGAALRLALRLPTWDALAHSFVVHNTSLTELAFRPGELQLRSFNALPHLPRRDLITLR